MTETDVRVVELFAGVGGFRLGLERSSNRFRTIWANQWEPGRKVQHAFDCYQAHFGDSPAHVNEDIAVAKAQVPAHDLLVGGFPCQDYSVARTKADGIQGKKGVLWWEIKSIIEKQRPPFILLENVDRLLKSPAKQRGRDFGIMLLCLHQLGYHVEWRVINAAEYGFPQRRRRVFIFGFRADTLLAEHSSRTDMNEWVQSEGFFSQAFPVVQETYPTTEGEMPQSLIETSDHFTYRFANTGFMRDGRFVSMAVKPVAQPETPLRRILDKAVPEKYYLGEDLSLWEYMKGAKKEERTSKTTGHVYYYTEGAIAFPDDIDRPGRTMLTSEGKKNRSTHIISDPETGRIRLLTPEECEKMNDFSAGWTDTGMPESFRYFCMGNALVVGLIERMGKNLLSIMSAESVARDTLAQVATSKQQSLEDSQ